MIVDAYGMTIAEVLRDSLIRRVMRADGVSPVDMETLLLDAAAKVRGSQHKDLESLRGPRGQPAIWTP